MTFDRHDDDVDLGRRLSAALHAEAARTEIPPDSWQRFRDRSSAEDYVIADVTAVGAEPVSAIAPVQRRRAWRVPLIAAAAAVAIAVATTAVATGGFGATHRVATPYTGSPATPVRVPVDTTYQVYVMESGSAGAAPASSEVGTTAPSSWPAAPPTAVVMSFVGSAPPEATLSGRFAYRTAVTPVQDAQRRQPDGTPLGYIAHGSAVVGDAPGVVPEALTTLWGAVGPDVAQLRISSDLPATVNGLDPGLGTAEARWAVDSGAGTAFSAAGSETSIWTPMFGGWHGFAVQLPIDASWATVVALGPAGQVLQDRRFDLGTGATTDLPVPPTSGQTASDLSTTATASSPPGLPPASATATLSPPAAASSLGDGPSSRAPSPGPTPGT